MSDSSVGVLSCLYTDELLVVIRGDTFVIISRARGWWVVQRDPTGSGAVDSDTSKQGWVPAGCLLETRIPVATAIAEASAASGLSAGSGVSGPTSRAAPSAAIPTCSEFPPANELCN